MLRTSCSSVVSAEAATAISSSLPSFLKSRCAVGRSKPARVAPPIERSELKRTMPATRSRSTGPSAWTPIVSPILKSSSSAVPSSMTTSFGPGQSPSTSASGLNGDSPRAIEKPRFGAPPLTTALPSRPISVVDSLSTPPSASATPSTPRTSSSTLSSKGGAVAPLPSERSNAALPVMTALDPLRTSVKIWSKAWSIESVRMYVPLTMVTPSTIASAVRIVLSFRPRRPLSANRVTRS